MENQALRDHRFKAGTPIPRHTQKHPNGYLTPLLKRLLTKKISFEDPETQKIIKSDVAHALLWRLILNGTQGETPAIKEIIDRIDGKQSDMHIDQSQHSHYVVFRNPKSLKENANDIKPRVGIKDAELSPR